MMTLVVIIPLMKVPYSEKSKFSMKRPIAVENEITRVWNTMEIAYENHIMMPNVAPVLWCLNNRLPNMKKPVVNSMPTR